MHKITIVLKFFQVLANLSFDKLLFQLVNCPVCKYIHTRVRTYIYKVHEEVNTKKCKRFLFTI